MTRRQPCPNCNDRGFTRHVEAGSGGWEERNCMACGRGLEREAREIAGQMRDKEWRALFRDMIEQRKLALIQATRRLERRKGLSP